MAKKSTIQWVQTNTRFWCLKVCNKTVAAVLQKESECENYKSFMLNADGVFYDFTYHCYPLSAASIEEAKKEVEALLEEALIPEKLQMARKIGEYFGDYTEDNGKFSIDNGEKVFSYNTVEELLADWLDTVLANHHDAYYIEENRLEGDSWEKEIVFIYTIVLQELPKGIKPSGVSSGDGFSWTTYCDVSLTKDNRPEGFKGHSKNLCTGTYSSLAEAIYIQQKLEERVKSKKYTLEELSNYATSLRCRVEWEQYGVTSYILKLCGNPVANLYECGAANGKDFEYRYDSTISPTHWHCKSLLKSSTLVEAQKELEAILLTEYEKYLDSLKKAIADYEDRVSALESVKKAVSDNV